MCETCYPTSAATQEVISPCEASRFVRWALSRSVFDDRTVDIARAFSAARRSAFEQINEMLFRERDNFRSFAHSRTPDQSADAVNANHKADTLTHIISLVGELEDAHSAAIPVR